MGPQVTELEDNLKPQSPGLINIPRGLEHVASGGSLQGLPLPADKNRIFLDRLQPFVWVGWECGNYNGGEGLRELGHDRPFGHQNIAHQ
jgi:hypothetical protein